MYRNIAFGLILEGFRIHLNGTIISTTMYETVMHIYIPYEYYVALIIHGNYVHIRAKLGSFDKTFITGLNTRC